MAKLVVKLFSIASAAALMSACIIKSSGEDDDGDQGTTTTSSGNTTTTGGAGGAGGGEGGSGGEGGITDPPCANDPGEDGDADGWTGAQGDCNDCQKWINPGAFDYVGNNIDEDCNDAVDDTVMQCDQSLALDSNDPLDGARAMDLCTFQSGESWGVIAASYNHIDGSEPDDADFDLGHGILTQFGDVVMPQGGGNLLAISSGAARNPGDPGYADPAGFDKGYTSQAAPGFPKESPACPGVVTGTPHDSIHLRMRIKTPTNARSFSFNVNMYTYEYPGYICREFNDFVTAIMSPAPTEHADAMCNGTPCGNISFDAMGNPLSVNAGFLTVCEPGTHGGKVFECLDGTDALAGTGFEGHASTGWLQTKAPVERPGEEIVLEFGAMDSADGILDTTGLFDNFQWDLHESIVITDPQPSP